MLTATIHPFTAQLGHRTVVQDPPSQPDNRRPNQQELRQIPTGTRWHGRRRNTAAANPTTGLTPAAASHEMLVNALSRSSRSCATTEAANTAADS